MPHTFNPWPLIGYSIGWIILAVIAACILIFLLGTVLSIRDTIRARRAKRRSTPIITPRRPSQEGRHSFLGRATTRPAPPARKDTPCTPSHSPASTQRAARSS